MGVNEQIHQIADRIMYLRDAMDMTQEELKPFYILFVPRKITEAFSEVEIKSVASFHCSLQLDRAFDPHPFVYEYGQ